MKILKGNIRSLFGHFIYILLCVLFFTQCKFVQSTTYPTEAEMMADLIGEVIEGADTDHWRFDYISEFKDFEILDWTVGKQTIEAKISTDLVDLKTRSLSNLI